MSTTNTIGQQILKARKSKNLTQLQLSVQMAISPQAVGKWERGESLPDLIQLQKLAKIFGLEIGYLMSDESTMNHKQELEGGPEPNIAELNIDEKKWDLSRGNWVEVEFTLINSILQKITSSNFEKCSFSNSVPFNLEVSSVNIENCKFNDSILISGSWTKANILDTNFTTVDFQGTHFKKCNIEKCDFIKSNLSHCEFQLSNLEGCNLNQAILEFTNFQKSNLSNIVFSGLIENCQFEGVSFSNVIFKDAILCNTFFKDNYQLKKVKFENCQVDQMTYTLLRNNHADVSNLRVTCGK